MATITDIQDSVGQLTATLTSIDVKLDEVKAFIETLKAGVPVTQEQIDALAAAVQGAKDSAASILTEADALDETP